MATEQNVQGSPRRRIVPSFPDSCQTCSVSYIVDTSVHVQAGGMPSHHLPHPVRPLWERLLPIILPWHIVWFFKNTGIVNDCLHQSFADAVCISIVQYTNIAPWCAWGYLHPFCLVLGVCRWDVDLRWQISACSICTSTFSLFFICDNTGTAHFTSDFTVDDTVGRQPVGTAFQTEIPDIIVRIGNAIADNWRVNSSSTKDKVYMFFGMVIPRGLWKKWIRNDTTQVMYSRPSSFRLKVISIGPDSTRPHNGQNFLLHTFSTRNLPEGGICQKPVLVYNIQNFSYVNDLL